MSFLTRLKIWVSATSKQKPLQTQKAAAIAATLEQAKLAYGLDEIATKHDLTELELSIKNDLIKWIASMMLAQAGIIAALVKLL